MRAGKRTGVRACKRTDMQIYGRAGVDMRKNEFKRGVLSVRVWSIKRAGVQLSTYKVYCMSSVCFS